MNSAFDVASSSPSPFKDSVHRYYGQERVIYGNRFVESLKRELEEEEAGRIFVVAAPEVIDSEAFEQLKGAIGSRFCGVFSQIPPHVPCASVFQGAEVARQCRAELIVVLGGGSAIDAAKGIALCLKFGITDMEGLRKYGDLSRFDPSRRSPDDLRWVRIVAIPSTLSAAEFTWFTGVTDTSEGVKVVVGHPMLVPRSVIYDPSLTLNVPLPVFLASGIKAVDHAAEKIASLHAQFFSDAVSKEALQMLARSLPRVAKDPADLEARMQCQVAAWLSIVGGASGVSVGASHAIGHMLGPHASISHGLTSCTMLASVMRWNISVNRDRQSIISAALGRPGLEAGDAIEALVQSLGLPHRLRDAGVSQDALPIVAQKTLEDALIHKNPRKIRGAEDVLEILKMAY